MISKTPTRREFCTQACQAASLATLAGALGTVLHGCGSGGGPTSPGAGGGGLSALPAIGATESGGTVVLDVGADSPLASVGAAAIVQTQSRFILVGHTSQDAFSAVTAICTHQGCTITEYANANQTYVCPCHGSRFDLQGRVLAGPAFSSLRQYGTQLANGQLTISL